MVGINSYTFILPLWNYICCDGSKSGNGCYVVAGDKATVLRVPVIGRGPRKRPSETLFVVLSEVTNV